MTQLGAAAGDVRRRRPQLSDIMAADGSFIVIQALQGCLGGLMPAAATPQVPCYLNSRTIADTGNDIRSFRPWGKISLPLLGGSFTRMRHNHRH